MTKRKNSNRAGGKYVSKSEYDFLKSVQEESSIKGHDVTKVLEKNKREIKSLKEEVETRKSNVDTFHAQVQEASIEIEVLEITKVRLTGERDKAKSSNKALITDLNDYKKANKELINTKYELTKSANQFRMIAMIVGAVALISIALIYLYAV